MPVVVDHSGDMPTRGIFMLHQGIQRRMRITLVHEKRSDFCWKDVKELVVGRIRNTQEYQEPDPEGTVLSLSLFPAHFLQYSNDDRWGHPEKIGIIVIDKLCAVTQSLAHPLPTVL